MKSPGMQGSAQRKLALCGASVVLREAVPEDAQRLRRMFDRCSEETVYLRFHSPMPTVPEDITELLVGPPEGGRVLVAAQGDEVVGHAMYARDEQTGGREAEVAVVVEDGWRSRGLGGLLLSEMAREARREGVEALTCVALGQNRRILSLLRRVFPDVRISYAAGALLMLVPFSESGARTVENIGQIEDQKKEGP